MFKYTIERSPYSSAEASAKVTVSNTIEGRLFIITARRLVRKNGYRCYVRGRDSNRKALFAKTGRRYTPGIGNANDISFGSPEGLLCERFALTIFFPSMLPDSVFLSSMGQQPEKKKFEVRVNLGFIYYVDAETPEFAKAKAEQLAFREVRDTPAGDFYFESEAKIAE